LGDMDLDLTALGEMGVVSVKLGEVEAGLRHVDEALAGALAGEGTFYTVVMTGCAMLQVCDMVADLDRATQWSRVADELMVTHGCPYLYARCRVVYGRVLVLTGDWQAAEDELQKAAAATQQAFRGLLNRTVASWADLRFRQGRTDDARALIESIDAPVETGLVAAAIALRSNDPASAVALAERWLHAEADNVAPPLHGGGRGASIDSACAYCFLVEANLVLGNLEAAEVSAEHLYHLGSLAGGPNFVTAHASLARGRIAAARGHGEESVGLFEAALRGFEALGLPLESASSRIELARAIAKSRPALAISEARTALSLLDRLGATAEADVAAALLRSWGASGRAVPRSAGPLTRREEEILGLLAVGLSNQEIADRLFISPRTAAHHVSNLLAKLGLRNRSEAAAYASRVRRDPSQRHT